MVEGGGIFGKDGWIPALFQMTSLIIGHNGKKMLPFLNEHLELHRRQKIPGANVGIFHAY